MQLYRPALSANSCFVLSKTGGVAVWTLGSSEKAPNQLVNLDHKTKMFLEKLMELPIDGLAILMLGAKVSVMLHFFDVM